MSNEELNDHTTDKGSKMVDDVSSTKSDKVTSSAMERRKISKPVMEKRRRARINASLSELKTFLLDIIKKEGFRQNKMEKADILELTVKHLRHLQRQQHSVPSAQIQSEEPGGNTFHLGFSECASEVSKFLTGLPNLEPDVHAKLLDHLSRCITVSKDTGYTLNASAQSTSTKSMTYSMQGSGHQSLNTPVSTVCSVAGRSERSIVRQETFLQRNRDIPYRDLHARPSSYESNNQKYVLASEMCKTQAMPIQLVDNVNTDNTKSDVRRANQSMPSIPLTMNQSPAISVGNVINGLQLVPIQFQNGDIAYAIPTNILSSAVIPSCVLSLVSPNSLSQTAINPSPKSLSSSNAEQKGLQSLSSNDCHYDPRTVRTEGQNCDQPHGLLESQRPDKPVPLISESLDRSTRVPIISRSSSSDTARLPIISCSQDTVNLTVMSPLESRSVVAPIIIPRSLDSVSNNVNNILPQRGDDSDEVWRPW